ncbi:MAG: DNA polymerase III subunit delta [Deltaproteobacteria bacterium]|nr:DNA polymerase III subunit delta [Deltaproteobacteria bacterium]
MDVRELIKTFTPDKIAPLYLLHGEETFSVIEFTALLKKTIIFGPMADFNYLRKKASETTGAKIVAEAKSMPMMAARRLIIIDDADKLKSGDMSPLVEYLENPSADSCLVFIGTKFDLRKLFFKKANSKKIVHKAEHLKERELYAFVKERADLKNIAISKEALMGIVQAVGADCSALDDALERVGLYANNKKAGLDDVEFIVSNIRQHSVFELVDALGNRNSANIMRYFDELISSREEPIRINAMLSRHIRQLLNVKIYQYKKVDGQSMGRLLGVPPFVVSKLIDQSRKFTSKSLENSLQRLALADLQLKSSRLTGQQVVELALLELAQY